MNMHIRTLQESQGTGAEGGGTGSGVGRDGGHASAPGGGQLTQDGEPTQKVE